MNQEQGLDFILSHFKEPLWPRTVSTKETHNSQILVSSKDESLKIFTQSRFKDCRIAAFGKYEQEKIIPNLIFVDLDNRDALNECLILFHKTTGSRPTVIHTGNGYAIIQPIKMRSWAGVTLGNKKGEELSKLFLSWAERYLTNNKCDSGNHPSLRNTMIRIPGSYNSKLLDKGKSLEESQVFVRYSWDGKRVAIENIRPTFIRYVNKIIKQESKLAKIDRKGNRKNYQWIDELLKCNIEDGRARLLFDVSRYLINLQGHTIDESTEKINSWLNSRYYSKSMIKSECKRAFKDSKYPRRIGTIKNTDQELYEIIHKEIKY
jgi:hypothetical protein